MKSRIALEYEAKALSCTSACSAFVESGGPFDIHYTVDTSGKEIPPDAALAKK
jgi:hypothetical protein